MLKSCRLQKTQHQGFDALELINKHISLCIVPELGGKIVSIRYLPTRREWLWRNPHLTARRPVYSASFTKAFDFGGLDECFPTVTPVQFPDVPWAGVPIPDHGEVWGQPWDVDIVAATAERIVLSMGCHGVRLPYRFERTLTLTADDPTIHLAYRATNLTPFAMPFIWTIHPILQIEPGMRLSLPDGVSQVRIDSTVDGFLGEPGTTCAWPLAANGHGRAVDLSQIPPPAAERAVKLFTLPLTGDDPVTTRLADGDGHGLGFRFLPTEITNVGLWLNYGRWTGIADGEPYYNLGLEPCIGGADSLLTASELGETAVLPPKQSRSWALDIILW